jgi:multidrug efflux system outer membrane protein
MPKPELKGLGKSGGMTTLSLYEIEELQMQTKFPLQVFKISALTAVLLAVISCSVEPTYERPEVPMSGSFKEAPRVGDTPLKPSEAGTWKVAQPSEALSRGEWWVVFGDEQLNALQLQAMEANQTLQAATARLKAARALSQVARSSLFPTLDGGFGATRQRVTEAAQPDGSQPYQNTMVRAQVGISYEVDMFGRVASSVDAAESDMGAKEALFRSVQLALQADVAQNYFLLRQLDSETQVLTEGIELRRKALELVQVRFDANQASNADIERAKSELASARSEGMTLQRARATSEHNLAVLLGKTPAEFSLPAGSLPTGAVSIPAGLPSALLERRPDIAAAEYEMRAANSRIGVAEAAFFPSLTLTGAGGFESDTLGSLFNWSSRAFLLGPLAGTALNIPLFDGGRRKGNLANAKAQYEEDVAKYRQQVLVAFREVEDNLVDLRILSDQTVTQNEAMASSQRVAQLSQTQYLEGAVNYFDVLDAQRTALQARRAAVQLQGVQTIATVNLIRALGGGWEHSALSDKVSVTQIK